MVDGLIVDIVCPVKGRADLEIRLKLKRGEVIGIYGDSGVGKTTLLRTLAGFIQPKSGSIQFGESTWFNSTSDIDLNPGLRKLNMVFQENSLYPHMSITQNIRFANNKLNTGQVNDLLSQLSMLEHGDKKPGELSGGQLQRAALARAFAQESEVLLLDEPLSSLDSSARSELQILIRKLHQEKNLCTIVVSHDLAELGRLSDIIYKLEPAGLIPIEHNPREAEVLSVDDTPGNMRFTIRWKNETYTFNKTKH